MAEILCLLPEMLDDKDQRYKVKLSRYRPVKALRVPGD
jgi:hypothetical protein